MGKVKRILFNPSGYVPSSTPAGSVEVLPGYKGPSSEKDLPYKLPPRQWHVGGKPKTASGTKKSFSPKAAAAQKTFIQVDGRSYTVDQIWTGLRFIYKVDNLAVQSGETEFNLFATHLGHTINNVAHWAEIGIIRAADDPVYRLYTYDPFQNPQYKFFGTTHPGEVFEFVIRMNEKPIENPVVKAGQYSYEILCDAIRVRQGEMPSLYNQVDTSHETFSITGTFSKGDYVMAVEGWLNYPPNKARWYAPDVNIGFYSTNTAVKKAELGEPFAYKFDSST
jgi:hypothetical protein